MLLFGKSDGAEHHCILKRHVWVYEHYWDLRAAKEGNCVIHTKPEMVQYLSHESVWYVLHNSVSFWFNIKTLKVAMKSKWQKNLFSGIVISECNRLLEKGGKK